MVSKNLPMGIKIVILIKYSYLVGMLRGENLCLHELLFGSIPFALCRWWSMYGERTLILVGAWTPSIIFLFLSYKRMWNPYYWYLDQCPKRFLSIIGWYPNVSSRTSYILYKFEVYSIDSSKLIINFPEVLNLNCLFLKLNRFICS